MCDLLQLNFLMLSFILKDFFNDLYMSSKKAMFIMIDKN